ncbi:cystathione beta-lyase [Salinibacterium xinjiangense]|uniref:cysteine-S-conjugate beta-lyase n=1 Tax=Salinibacterium xinjiangense TaxID=386302 RepID=A0A2C8YR28_9MICO|nr:aminotransferase class I/II-fold pyridoxal phosphate-dependent enzyme [Salinibacterium xinjiangense]SOE53035.1 cystathione beta-lyase [Salinibacterium xinjiangense]
MSIASSGPADLLRSSRSSLKWTRYPEGVLPLFVAEMDYPVSERIREAIIERVRTSDLGYIDSAGPLADAFSRFAQRRWGWTVDPAWVRVATDVSVGIVESLRFGVASGSPVVVCSPVYPPFFELVEEAGLPLVDVPMLERVEGWQLDLARIEEAFIAGARAVLLCNPHNPLGVPHDREALVDLAMLAARHDVLVIADEVHAPLTHHGAVFTPFATVAAEVGARSVTVTSASKGWNMAGMKCALMVPSDARTLAMLDRFPQEVASRTSILGLHANVAAYGDEEWLDATISRIMRNDALLAHLLHRKLPVVHYRRPTATYLGWLDFRDLGFGMDPAERVLQDARVALNSGPAFGAAGRGHARINFACDPTVLEEAVERMASAFA